MPAGDAGLKRQTFRQRFEALMREPVDDSHGGVDAQRYHRATQQLYRLTGETLTEINRLQAQLAAQQAVVDAARELWQVEPGVSVRSAWRDAHLRLGVALAALDKAQAAQPEGEMKAGK